MCLIGSTKTMKCRKCQGTRSNVQALAFRLSLRLTSIITLEFKSIDFNEVRCYKCGNINPGQSALVTKINDAKQCRQILNLKPVVIYSRFIEF